MSRSVLSPRRSMSSSRRPAVVAAGLVLSVLCALVAFQALAQEEGSLASALEAQYQEVRDRPNDATVYNDLGNLLAHEGYMADAEQAYRRAIDLNGGMTKARFNLGLLLQQSGRDGEALEQFRIVLELEPRHAWALYQSGAVYEGRDERDAAIEHYARAFALDPSLTFAENNPHIIDNGLATEALLMSSRYASTVGGKVPRQYDEGDRIYRVMVDAAKAEAAADEQAAGGPTDGGAEDVQSRPLERAGANQGGTPNARFDDDEAIPLHEVSGSGSGSGDPSGATERGDDGRVITAADLDTGSSVGQVTGGGRDADRRPERRVTPSRRIVAPPAPAPNRDRRVIGEPDSPRPAGNDRFRPSQRSTASVELRLLPEGEEESVGVGTPVRG